MPPFYVPPVPKTAARALDGSIVEKISPKVNDKGEKEEDPAESKALGGICVVHCGNRVATASLSKEAPQALRWQ